MGRSEHPVQQRGPRRHRDTEGTRRIHEDSGRGAHELNRVPVGRFGRRADIAGAVAYLVSPAGRYVNGTDLVVDGGRQFSFGKA
jgi:NAD(P)-dependent dehydrogenase (short-subunit alcohol dehydrogenase family)